MPEVAEVGRVDCGTCGRTIKFPISREGATGNCPGCGELMRLVNSNASGVIQTKVIAKTVERLPTPAPKPPSIPVDSLATKKVNIVVPAWSIPIAVGVLMFGLGFFAGREHLKYQIQSNLKDLGNAFATAFGGDEDPNVARKNIANRQKMAAINLEIQDFVISTDEIFSGTIEPDDTLTLVMTPEWHRWAPDAKQKFEEIVNKLWRDVHEPTDLQLKVVLK